MKAILFALALVVILNAHALEHEVRNVRREGDGCYWQCKECKNNCRSVCQGDEECLDGCFSEFSFFGCVLPCRNDKLRVSCKL